MAKNPDTHVRRIVDACFPGISDRAIDRRTGIDKLMTKFDIASRQRKVPDSKYVEALARALEVDFVEIWEAASADAGVPLQPAYDREQHRAARLVGQIPAGRRGRFVDGVDAMLDAFEIKRESGGPS